MPRNPLIQEGENSVHGQIAAIGAPSSGGSSALLRQIPQGIYRPAFATQFKMQHGPISTAPHPAYNLTLRYVDTLINQQLPVVTVGREVIIFMFEDNQISVSHKTATTINHPTGCRRLNLLPLGTADIDPLLAIFIAGKRRYYPTLHGPLPVYAGRHPTGWWWGRRTIGSRVSRR